MPLNDGDWAARRNTENSYLQNNSVSPCVLCCSKGIYIFFNPADLTLQNTADDVIRQIDSVFAHHKTRSPERLVLLAHDQVYADVNDSIELHNFIRLLKLNEDYELELVSDYPGVKN